MTGRERNLIAAAFGLLERRAREAREAVEIGATTPAVRTKAAELLGFARQVLSTVDDHIGAAAVLERAEKMNRETVKLPRPKLLSSSHRDPRR